jgi:hypothetical protein
MLGEPTGDGGDGLGTPGSEEVTTAEIREVFEKSEGVSLTSQSTRAALLSRKLYPEVLHVELEVLRSREIPEGVLEGNGIS